MVRGLGSVVLGDLVAPSALRGLCCLDMGACGLAVVRSGLPGMGRDRCAVSLHRSAAAGFVRPAAPTCVLVPSERMAWEIAILNGRIIIVGHFHHVRKLIVVFDVESGRRHFFFRQKLVELCGLVLLHRLDQAFDGVAQLCGDGRILAFRFLFAFRALHQIGEGFHDGPELVRHADAIFYHLRGDFGRGISHDWSRIDHGGRDFRRFDWIGFVCHGFPLDSGWNVCVFD